MAFKNGDRVMISQEGYNLMSHYYGDKMVQFGMIGVIRTVGAYGEELNYIPPGWYLVVFEIPTDGSLNIVQPRDYSTKALTVNERYLISADKPNFVPPDIPDTAPGQSQEIQQVYIATIQVVIAPKDGHTAEDVISAVLSENTQNDSEFLDWQYLNVGGQFMKPTITYVSKDYHEGDAFQK
jgi:hypothetical protein